MTLKEHFYLIKSKILRKNNVIFMLAMIVLLLILFISLGLIQFFWSFKINSEHKDINVRSIVVYEENTPQNVEKIENIEHVTFVGSNRLYHSVYTPIREFDKSSRTAEIEIMPIVQSDQLKVVSGKKQISNGEALCPMKFYPYYSVRDGHIIDKYVIKGKKAIGKTFTSETVKDNLLHPDEIYYKEFEIVGVYDQRYNMASLDRCYVTIDDFLDIFPLNYVSMEGIDENGNKYRDVLEYNDLYLIVDDYKNMGYVMNKLNNLGFAYEPASRYDEEDSSLYVIVPLFISIVIMIFVINIIHNFNCKKIKQKMTYYGLLKAIGYDNKTILKNQLLENMICYMISFIISFSMIVAGFITIKKYLLYDYICDGMIVEFPLFIIILGFIITLTVLIIINKRILNKKLKLTVGELIRDDI